MLYSNDCCVPEHQVCEGQGAVVRDGGSNQDASELLWDVFDPTRMFCRCDVLMNKRFWGIDNSSIRECQFLIEALSHSDF